MTAAFCIEGFVIASADGNIADDGNAMPQDLQSEADQAHFSAALDVADLLVHGAHSHEGQARSDMRRRLIMTRRRDVAKVVAGTNAFYWNPEDASLAQACEAFDLRAGRVAVLGGPEVYLHFLHVGYDAFYLSRMGGLVLPGGRPVFARRAVPESAETLLARHGLMPGAAQLLEAERDVTLTIWRARP